MRALDPGPSEEASTSPTDGDSASERASELIPVRRIFALVGVLLALVVALVVTGVLAPTETPRQAVSAPTPSPEAPDRDVAAICARTVSSLPESPGYEPAVAGVHALQLVDLRPSLGAFGEDFSVLEQWTGDPAELVLCISEAGAPRTSSVNCPTSSGPGAVDVEAQSVLVELRAAHSGEVLWSNTYHPDQSTYCSLVESGAEDARLRVTASLPAERIAFIVSRWATTGAFADN